MLTVKTLREAAGMTQQAFADYFGIPKRSIENWEGEQRKCPEYLLDLMEYKLQKEGITKAA
jgi:DNA-binding transcriptional regulator YiaG